MSEKELRELDAWPVRQKAVQQMKTKTTEHYYAIRIGSHQPYFMLGDDRETPKLFAGLEAAKVAVRGISKRSHIKVVKVILSE